VNGERCGPDGAGRAICNFGGLRFFAGPLLALTISAPASANNLVVNGDFEMTTNGANLQFDRLTQATGWTSTPTLTTYNFIFSSGAADIGGATGEFGNVSSGARAPAQTTASLPRVPLAATSLQPIARSRLGRYHRPSTD